VHLFHDLSFQDFVNFDLVRAFAKEWSDSIPSVVDGFDANKRNIMSALMNCDDQDSAVQVAELAEFVNKMSAFQARGWSFEGSL
jgi:hypothetical protein